MIILIDQIIWNCLLKPLYNFWITMSLTDVGNLQSNMEKVIAFTLPSNLTFVSRKVKSFDVEMWKSSITLEGGVRTVRLSLPNLRFIPNEFSVYFLLQVVVWFLIEASGCRANYYRRLRNEPNTSHRTHKAKILEKLYLSPFFFFSQD